MNKRRNGNGNRKRFSLARDLDKPTWKIRIVGGLILLLFLGVCLRALELQVLDRGRILEFAEGQHTGIFTLLPRRGKILDRKGRELAVNIDTESIYVHPKRIENPKLVSEKLSHLLDIPLREIQEILSSKKPFIWVKRLVHLEAARGVKEANPGDAVGFIKETKRIYPNGHLAGQLIGFTDIDSKGIEGLEYYLESYLAGRPGKITVKRDALGREIASGELDVEDSTSGLDVVLTIDSKIQHILEGELEGGVKKSRGDGGMAVLMDPETGKILGMASYPFFNPNKFESFSSGVRKNFPVWFTFEPGSIMKVFLLAAALEEKAVAPTTRFNCEKGRKKVGSKTIKDVHPYGVLTVTEVIKYSSNICASKIAEALGREKYYKYLKGFGFGASTGVDLPGESAGSLRDYKEWRPIEFATLSFGQGVSVTAVQLASALSAIANGGLLMRPYVLERVIDPEGKTIHNETPEIIRRVISYDTGRAVTRVMEEVMKKGGTGEGGSIPGYRIAGKTGTAQVPDLQSGGYSGRYIASFMGFAPTDAPRITLVVVVENPKTSPYGGVVALPIFKNIMEKVIAYLGIPPGEKLPEDGIMPNLLGMSARDVLRWAEKQGIEIRMKGSGSVAHQVPLPGERIREGTVCLVELKHII